MFLIEKKKSIFKLLSILLTMPAVIIFAQETRILTLEESLNIALGKSYQVKQLEQSLVNSRMSLKAAESSFKSNGELVFTRLPNLFRGISQTQSPTGEVVFPKQDFLDLQAELFVNQPISTTDGIFSVVEIG